LDQHMKSNSIC